ncbi:hypothetical protein M422DRAFT_195396, partial [Sphaerobolus stellatus SS14]
EVPLVSANLANLLLESFLYGTFIILWATYLYLFSAREERQQGGGPGGGRRRWYMHPIVISSALLMITLSVHWCLTFKRAFQAFVTYKGGEAPLEFYADLTQRTEVVKTGFLIASLCLGDMMIIYRLWIVWGFNNYIIIFPICTLCSLAVSGAGITYQLTRYTPGESVFASAAGRWIISDSAFTLWWVIYFDCPVLLAYRVWSINRSTVKFGGSSLNVSLL